MGKEDGIWHLEGAGEESGQTELEAELGEGWVPLGPSAGKALDCSGKALPGRTSPGRGSLAT